MKEKAMNNVYEELDEAKNEIEILKVALRGKTTSFKNLKRSHDAQVNIIQEVISKVEKLEQELHQKAHEFIYAEQLHEYHNSNLSLVERSEQQRTNDQLKTNATTIEKLETELECSDSFNIEMMLLNEEMYVMLLVLKEGIYEYNELQQSVYSECNYHKVMFEKSTKCRTKIDLEEQHEEVYGGLEKPNIDLDERTYEISEMEFELQMWKSMVESLKNDLEENRVMRKTLEKSLLAQVDFSESLKQEKDSLNHKLEVEENKIDYLQLHVFVLEHELKARETKASEQESFRREFERDVIAKCNVERENEFEIENHIKRKNIELMQHVTSLEKEFTVSLIPFNSQLNEKHAEIIQVQEVCDKIIEAEALAIIEFEEKKLMMEELEDDINDMENKLKLQEENLSQLKQLALDIEMKIDSKQLRIKELTCQMENKLRDSDVLLQKIKMEDKSLLENGARLSQERESLLGFVTGLGDKTSDYANADINLADAWRNVVQSVEKDCVGGTNFKNDDELFVKENTIVHSPTRLNKSENLSDLVTI